MRAAFANILAVLVFLASTLVLGAIEGYVRGYWPEAMFEGETRWAAWLADEWWLYAGRGLLVASIIALALLRFAAPRVRTRLHLAQSWWLDELALLACFVLATIPALVFGYVYSMPAAFIASVLLAGCVLKLEAWGRRSTA